MTSAFPSRTLRFLMDGREEEEAIKLKYIWYAGAARQGGRSCCDCFEEAHRADYFLWPSLE